jgi:hypothetical protein
MKESVDNLFIVSFTCHIAICKLTNALEARIICPVNFSSTNEKVTHINDEPQEIFCFNVFITQFPRSSFSSILTILGKWRVTRIHLWYQRQTVSLTEAIQNLLLGAGLMSQKSRDTVPFQTSGNVG